jgi:hypothetical protein
MMLAQFNIKNITDEIQPVSVFELDNNNKNIEHSFELKESSEILFSFEGFRFINCSGGKVDKCFDKKIITFNNVDVCATEWLTIYQNTVDFVDIKLRILNLIESIEFRLNPKEEIKIQMLYNEKVKLKLKNVRN